MKEYIIVLMPLVLIILLMIATIFDVKDRTIPLWITFIGISIKGIELVMLEPKGIKYHLAMCFILFAVLFTNVLLGGLGGADSLIGAMCGLYLGIYGIYAIMIAFILSMPYAAYIKFHKNDKEYPFIPYVLLAVSMVLMYGLAHGEKLYY